MRKFPIEEIVTILVIIIFVLKWVFEKMSEGKSLKPAKKASRKLMGEKPWKMNRNKSLQERMAEDHGYFEEKGQEFRKEPDAKAQRAYEATSKSWGRKEPDEIRSLEIYVNGKRYRSLDQIPRNLRHVLVDEFVKLEEHEMLGSFDSD